jgi:hypothetical protein
VDFAVAKLGFPGQLNLLSPTYRIMLIRLLDDMSQRARVQQAFRMTPRQPCGTS